MTDFVYQLRSFGLKLAFLLKDCPKLFLWSPYSCEGVILFDPAEDFWCLKSSKLTAFEEALAMEARRLYQ